MSDTPIDPLDGAPYKDMSMADFRRLLDRAQQVTYGAESLQVIADVGAMLGMSTRIDMVGERTIGDVRGKYQPKSEVGKQIQTIVERALAEHKAKREARRAQTREQVPA